ncbi:RNA ligase family protein, partial [Streptomyces sp. DT225]
LWAVRSGAPVDAGALRAAVGAGPADGPPHDGPKHARAAADALDALGRTGDDRLTGVLAALLHTTRRTALAPLLAPALGMPQARRVADLVGLAPGLHRPYPDGERRAGLAR